MHTEKTAAGPTPEDFQKFWGDRILRTGVRGLGLGAGAASLYYLARGLSEAARQRAAAAKADEQARLVGELPEKQSGAMQDLYDNAAKGIGKILPDNFSDVLKPFTPAVPGGKDNVFDPNVMRSSFGIGGTLAAGGLGALGGWQLVNMLHKIKKKRDRQQEVDDAEQEYYSALTGHGAKHAGWTLDAVADEVFSKAAAEKQSAFEWLTKLYDTVKRVPAAVGGTYVATGLGLGGLAAKLMYDRARDRSRAKAVEEAAKSRARIAGILPTYVDPDEISSLRDQVQHAQAG